LKISNFSPLIFPFFELFAFDLWDLITLSLMLRLGLWDLITLSSLKIFAFSLWDLITLSLNFSPLIFGI